MPPIEKPTQQIFIFSYLFFKKVDLEEWQEVKKEDLKDLKKRENQKLPEKEESLKLPEKEDLEKNTNLLVIFYIIYFIILKIEIIKHK